MRKHLIATLLLMSGLPMAGTFTAMANPEPQQQGQAVSVIQGTVLDENNEPVIGASVSQKGTKGNAVATDAFGNFKIRVAAGTPLEVSYVGYKNETVAAANGMTVYMQPTTEMLNELVAIGYGTQKRANLTGAVATVDVARTMDSRPQTDVAKALQGAVPGLTITSNNGDITSSGSATMRIRGTGTLSNSQTSSPLIVVDGVPVDDLSYVNPDDIAEISVLKDASSSAIYGTRAAFGVILITTKTPNKQDKVSVKYTNNFGWSGATTLPQYSDVPTQLHAMIDQQMRSGGDTELFGMHFTNLLPYAEKWQQQNGKPRMAGELRPYVDENNVGDYYVMYDPLTGKVAETLYYADWNVGKIWYNDAAPSNKHNVSLEGVSGKTNYRASFGYDKRTALENYNPGEMRRYTAAVNVNTQIFDWLKAGVRFNYSSKEYTGPNNVVGQASPTYLWRWGSYFNPYGYREYDGKDYWYKCVEGRFGGKYQDWASDTKIQAYMDANIIKGLTLHADYTYDLQNYNSMTSNLPVYAWNNWTNTGLVPEDISTKTQASQSNARSVLWTTNVYATYDKTFAQDYNLKVMVGGTAEQYNYNTFAATRANLLDTNLPYLGLTDGGDKGTDMSISNTLTHRATAGFFGRVNFDYKGIYLLEFNGRYDGSSRFPARQQWGFFPSGSIGYRFSEEQYFTPAKEVVSNGKIRASYGAIGNEAIGSNMFISTISGPSNYYWLQNGGTTPTKYSSTPTLVSSSLTWERVETLDIGLDMGFFNNSLTLNFDWFQRDTKNMLAPGLTLPGILGASAPYTNEGHLRTRGWELGLGYNHSFGDWDVYANFNIYDGTTKVVKYYNENEMINSFYTGAEFGAIWGLETDRYFTTDDCKPGTFELDYTTEPGGKLPDQTYLQSGSFVFGPGDIKFKDLDGNGVIDGGIRTEAEAKNHPEIWKDPNDFSKGWYAAGSDKNHGDLKKIGNELPRYEYSFRLGAAWKGFDIDAYFQGVGKRDYWSCSAFVMPLTRGADATYANQNDYNKIIYDAAGKVTGYDVRQDADFPCLFPGAANAGKLTGLQTGRYNFYPQTKYLQDMSYLRFKQLTFGYTLPVNITRKALIQKARLYFSAENLCLLHNGMKGTGIDPEIESSHNAMAGTKNEQFGRVTPMTRTFSFGVQVSF